MQRFSELMVENITLPNSVTEELAEEIGWHIGDGSMNYYNNKGYNKGIYQLRGHIKDDKEHYINVIKPCFKLLYGLDINLRVMPSTRVLGFQIWSNRLIEFKRGLELPLGKKTDIFIPKILLINDCFKKAVIRGIFDTDGCIYLQSKYGKLYPRFEITTISLKLAKQIKNLLVEMGIRTTYYSFQNKKGNRKRAYKISIRGIGMSDKFMEMIKPANPKHVRKYKLFKESFK